MRNPGGQTMAPDGEDRGSTGVPNIGFKSRWGHQEASARIDATREENPTASTLLTRSDELKVSPGQSPSGNSIAGRSLRKEYLAWVNMIGRCSDPRHNRFDRYGGRGIKVCEKWLRNFIAFLNDVGRAPSRKHTLGRIDNDGDYEPGNVHWETWSEQNLNRSASKCSDCGSSDHNKRSCASLKKAPQAREMRSKGASLEAIREATGLPIPTIVRFVGKGSGPTGRPGVCRRGHERTGTTGCPVCYRANLDKARKRRERNAAVSL
jgi:hypothetical protein